MELIAPEKRTQAFYQSNIRMNILYVVVDICEALLAEVEDYQRIAGVEKLKYEQKMYWKALFKDTRNLRKVMNLMPENMQYSYAETAEILQDLLLKAIDRCGEEDFSVMRQFIDYIKSFPSKRNIEFKYD